MARSKTFDDDIVYRGSSYQRAKQHYLKIIKLKQLRIARWSSRYANAKKRWALRVEKELAKLNKRWEAKFAKEVQKRKDLQKKCDLQRFALSKRISALLKSNAKLIQDSRDHQKTKRFYTKSFAKKGVMSEETLIRYVYWLEIMFQSGELNKYGYLLLLSASQSEYITKNDMTYRYGERLAQKAFNEVEGLVDEGLILKFNNHPIRIAITDLGRAKVKGVLYSCKNRSMKNYTG